ncbi:hypothetical protein [Saccharothrix obliqua]|uniref:hypothetical protein n=1 Tax=Saccharothrix obliqua TaxID=2861747 RepID=UPI001C5EB8D0|nr:hypothetical protein [Saccharothrix obliqua]MBW4718584.1 hypothetical protein [Saccharothrix obliqua]
MVGNSCLTETEHPFKHLLRFSEVIGGTPAGVVRAFYQKTVTARRRDDRPIAPTSTFIAEKRPLNRHPAVRCTRVRTSTD